jgi:hypothetical protein
MAVAVASNNQLLALGKNANVWVVGPASVERGKLKFMHGGQRCGAGLWDAHI